MGKVFFYGSIWFVALYALAGYLWYGLNMVLN